MSAKLKSAACGCKPGSAASGWHEVRSADCLRREREALGAVVAWCRQKFGGAA